MFYPQPLHEVGSDAIARRLARHDEQPYRISHGAAHGDRDSPRRGFELY